MRNYSAEALCFVFVLTDRFVSSSSSCFAGVCQNRIFSISIVKINKQTNTQRLQTALMPGGDHLNIIDPPGLTVMRIAGGRYRVTAAHRVVWTWMNEFASLSFMGDPDSSDPLSVVPPSSGPELEMGDLVTLTIVDVFETDSQVRNANVDSAVIAFYAQCEVDRRSSRLAV